MNEAELKAGHLLNDFADGIKIFFAHAWHLNFEAIGPLWDDGHVDGAVGIQAFFEDGAGLFLYGLIDDPFAAVFGFGGVDFDGEGAAAFEVDAQRHIAEEAAVFAALVALGEGLDELTVFGGDEDVDAESGDHGSENRAVASFQAVVIRPEVEEEEGEDGESEKEDTDGSHAKT